MSINMVEIVKTHVLEKYNSGIKTERMNMYETHVKYVVEYAKELANKLNADIEIVEISALFHDIARIDGSHEEHHIDGARYAESFLQKYNYNQEKIEKVKHCILSHSGSRDIKRETLEAECLASADAMAHFRNISDMFYFVYHDLGVSSEKGKAMIKAKLERSYNKMIKEAKNIIQEKYDAAMKLLT